MGDDFVLHERLAADTAALADWPLCRVLLMNDQSWPWLILVPRRPDLKEIHDLDRDARAQLTEEICRASRALQTSFRSEEHTSELQSLMRISSAVFCLQKKNTVTTPYTPHSTP